MRKLIKFFFIFIYLLSFLLWLVIVLWWGINVFLIIEACVLNIENDKEIILILIWMTALLLIGFFLDKKSDFGLLLSACVICLMWIYIFPIKLTWLFIFIYVGFFTNHVHWIFSILNLPKP